MVIDKYHKHPKYLRKAIDQAVLNAVKFFEDYYPKFSMSKFDGITVKLSKTCSFAYYDETKGVIRIDQNRLLWHTYIRKTVGVYAFNIKHVDLIASITVQLIHEMTHHIQHCEDRKFSEVETTKNEIEWMRVHRPQFHAKLKTI